MIVTLEEVKEHLKLEEDYIEEDDYFKILIKASEKHLKFITGKKFDSTNELAKIICLVIVADWYQNRSLMEEGKNSSKVRLTINSILTQLEYSEEGVSNENKTE